MICRHRRRVRPAIAAALAASWMAGATREAKVGAIAQLGERLLCKQDVVGSIPSGSTNLLLRVSVGAGLIVLISGMKQGR